MNIHPVPEKGLTGTLDNFGKYSPKGVTLILRSWAMPLEADAGRMAVEGKPSRPQLVSFVAVQQIAAE
jgi:hypothetical protein